MAGLLTWWGGDKAGQNPSQAQTQEPSANVYVTQREMMDALEKLQSRIEDRIQGERNKRAQRFQKLTEDVAKRFAEVEGHLLHEIQQQRQQHLVENPQQSSTSGVGPTPADVERIAQDFAQRETRLAAMLGEKTAVPSLAPPAPPDVDGTTTVVSGAAESGSRALLLEQLKAKVERLENGSKTLVAEAAEALTRRVSDDMVTNGEGVPETTRSSVGNLSITSECSEPAGFADQVLSWTTKLDKFESGMQLVSRRVTDVEVQMKEIEQQLDRRVQASIKKEIHSLGLDRGR